MKASSYRLPVHKQIPVVFASVGLAISSNTIVRKVLASLWPVALVTAITLGVAHPLLRPGIPLYIDNPMHLAQAYFMVEQLLPETLWITGWANYILAGFPVSLYYSQVGFLLVSMLNILAGIPVELAYKLALLGAYAFSGWALYRLIARKFGSRAGTVCCSLWLFQYPAIEGLTSIFGGMWNQSLGIGFLFLFIDTLDSLYQRFTLGRLTIGGALLGLIVLSHPFAALAAGLVFGIYYCLLLAGFVRSRQPLRIIAWLVVPLIGLGLSAFYLLPIAETGRWVPPAEWPGYKSALLQVAYMLFLPTGQTLRETPWLVTMAEAELVRGDIVKFLSASVRVLYYNLPDVSLGLLSLVGLAYLVGRGKWSAGRQRVAIVAVIFSVVSFCIATDYYLAVPGLKDVSFFKTMLTPRFVVFVRFGLLVLAALALSQPPNLRYLGNKVVFNVASLLLILLAALSFYYSVRDGRAMLVLDPASDNGDVQRVWQWLREHVDGTETRVLYQDTYGNLPPTDPLSTSHLLGLSAHYTGVAVIGPDFGYPLYPTGKLVSTEAGSIFGTSVMDASPEYIAKRMQIFNAGYIVAVEPNLTGKLSASVSFAHEVSFGYFNIFRSVDYVPAWFVLEDGALPGSQPLLVEAPPITKESGYPHPLAPSPTSGEKGNPSPAAVGGGRVRAPGGGETAGSAEVLGIGQNRMSITFDSGKDDSRLLVRYSYHPYWRATINGEPAQIEPTPDYLMVVPIPKSGRSEVILTYHPSNLPAIAAALAGTVAILGLLALGLACPRLTSRWS